MARKTRLCFVAYRGNMNCGGQGVYLWFLCRELAALGFEIDVFVGPPYPDEMPFAARVHRIEIQEHWAKWFTRDYAGMIPKRQPHAALAQVDSASFPNPSRSACACSRRSPRACARASAGT